jgi:hypothetical protein
MEADFTYFRRRAQEEREAAMKAPHPGARQAHVEMAERYDEFAAAIVAHHETLNGEPVGAA